MLLLGLDRDQSKNGADRLLCESAQQDNTTLRFMISKGHAALYGEEQAAASNLPSCRTIRAKSTAGSCANAQIHPPRAASPSQCNLLSIDCTGSRSKAATHVGVTCAAVGTRSVRKQNVSPPEEAVITIMSGVWPGAARSQMPGASSVSSSRSRMRPASTRGS